MRKLIMQFPGFNWPSPSARVFSERVREFPSKLSPVAFSNCPHDHADRAIGGLGREDLCANL